jgi:LmbE family N-acetylglucosaminyl deacetylase
LDFTGLRQLNLSALLRDGAQCTWRSLVADIVHVLALTKLTVIVLPDPWLDPHTDHGATTAAVCEALRETGQRDWRFFFNLRSQSLVRAYSAGASWQRCVVASTQRRRIP